MKRVAVLGGGPAGAMAAERLSAAGISTVLLDEKLAWEKPCGGGVTYKAYRQYPFLENGPTARKTVTTTWLSTENAGAACLRLNRPLLIFSRYDLNRLLLERAERAGAQLEQERVTGIERHGSGWSIRTRRGCLDADYLVVATGARNPLRAVGTEYRAGDTMYALGYYIPYEQDHIDIQFFDHFEGYIWIFPRCGHLSAGICGKGESAQALRRRLEEYLASKGIPLRDASFYGHMLPALESPSWKRNRVSGDGWLAAGDSAGLVDPVTGEGIYYALRSGDMAGELLGSGRHEPAALGALYRRQIGTEFADDLAYASSLAKRVFLGEFMRGPNTGRMVQFIRRSPRLYDIMQEMFAGTMSYFDLRAQVRGNLRFALAEVALNLFLRKVLPADDPITG